MSEGDEGTDSPSDSDGDSVEPSSGNPDKQPPESRQSSGGRQAPDSWQPSGGRQAPDSGQPSGGGQQGDGSQLAQGSDPSGNEPAADFDDRVDRALTAVRRGGNGPDPSQLVEYTTDRRDLAPTVRVLWGIWAAVGVIVLALILTGIIRAVGWPVALSLPLWGLLFALGILWVELRYRVWVYQVQEDSLYLERGVITHRRTHVPYVRIQHVDTSRGPVERWLGLSTLVVYTAGSRGADVSVPGLEPAEARDLQGRVKDLAIDAEGGDAL